MFLKKQYQIIAHFNLPGYKLPMFCRSYGDQVLLGIITALQWKIYKRIFWIPRLLVSTIPQ